MSINQNTVGLAWQDLEGHVVSGAFPLRQHLGGSESGAVFLTECPARGLERAAIKLVPAIPATADLQLSRWRLAAELSHPNLIQLFDMGRCQLRDAVLFYLVMECAEENLSQVLPRRALTPAEAREMLLPTLNALAFLHSKGFVHGRIKPANILATGDQLKLSSDSLHRIGDSSASFLKPGPYDSPESASGALSPAGDVWSLGMTLVEALTQHIPARQAHALGGDADPLVPETVPAPFLDLARRCLRQDPQRRWSAAYISARLQQASPAEPGNLQKQSPQTQVPQKPASPTQSQQRETPQPQAPQNQQALKPQPEALTIPHYALPAGLVLLFALALVLLPRLGRLFSGPRPVQTAGGAEQTSKRAEQSSGNAAQTPAAVASNAEPNPAGARVVKGEVLQEISPEVPQKARDTIRGTVKVSVRVAVNASGDVVDATLASPGPSRYFANLAIEAARRWEFSPAQVNGHYVSSEWLLRFEFTPTTTKAFPLELAP